MRHVAFALAYVLFVGTTNASFAADVKDAVPANVKRQIFHRYDFNRDGKLSIAEKGAARLAVGSVRQANGVKRNNKIVRTIR
ncbi:MAG: hypothetical protein C0483_25580 [Pirellula sp.]|nr:hypothetical protein [Pirellula sp.]